MPETKYNLRTTTQGVRDFRGMRAQFADQGGDGQGSDSKSLNGPQAVRAVGAAEPGTTTEGFLLDHNGEDVRGVELTAIETIAFRLGRRGLCIVQPRYFAVLVDDLPESPEIYATGTIAAGSDQLTTSVDLSAYIDDYTVIVCGAGTGGKPLITTIASATATIATLDDDAVTAVTDADIGILAVADAWILERNECGRLIQKLIDGEPVTKPVVGDFRHIGTIEADTLIGIEFQEAYWVPYKMDCEPSEWEWPAISS